MRIAPSHPVNATPRRRWNRSTAPAVALPPGNEGTGCDARRSRVTLWARLAAGRGALEELLALPDPHWRGYLLGETPPPSPNWRA